MSFDLKIVNGDISLSNDGDILQVRNTEKLRQDALKITLTPKGSNKYHRWYGVLLAAIGQAGPNPTAVKQITSTSIQESLANLLLLQREQKKRQVVTPEETMLEIRDLSVSQNEIDPRQYDVKYFIVSEAFTVIDNETFFRPF